MDVTRRIRFVVKPLLFLSCLVPFALVIADLYGVGGGSLGANPIEEIQDRLGNWGLRFLMLVLAVTPLRQISGRAWLTRLRRMLGLFAFFYVFMHFLVWLILDQELMLSAIAADIVERPFITLGFAALLILSALATTSTARMRRRMGRAWQKLHNCVYVAAVLGVWHYWWQVKQDIREPLIYASILAVLLGYRVMRKLRRPATPAPHRVATGSKGNTTPYVQSNYQ